MSTVLQTLRPPSLPWSCSADDLPRPLPTNEEIEAATDEFPSIFDSNARRTVLVKDIFVVKYGPFVFENEGHALMLLQSQCANEVPAPHIYAMYRENDKLYLVMEYVPGTQLSDLWPSLSEDEKTPIVHQLRHVCDRLRMLSSPGYYGGVYGGPIQHRYFMSVEKDPRVTGPFTKEEDVNRALILRSRGYWASCGEHGWMNDFFERHLSTVLSGHASVFTHSDFQRKNIIVREEPRLAAEGDTGTRRFKVAAVLDWEDAGWYPSYWAFASCFSYFDWCDDWGEKVERILDPYVPESALLRMVGQNMCL
ncbi:hypothetical protein HYQ45_012869 [Verticillium longisporum]